MASRKTVTLAIGSLLQPAWRPSTQRSLAVGRSAFLRTTVCTTLCGNLSSCAVRVGPGTCKALAQAQVLCQLLCGGPTQGCGPCRRPLPLESQRNSRAWDHAAKPCPSGHLVERAGHTEVRSQSSKGPWLCRDLGGGRGPRHRQRSIWTSQEPSSL